MDLQQLQDKVCQPALVYFVIATAMALCTFCLVFLQGRNTLDGHFVNLSSHVLSIVLCTLVLMGVCNIWPELSWAFVIFFVLCNVCAVSSALSTVVNVQTKP